MPLPLLILLSVNHMQEAIVGWENEVLVHEKDGFGQLMNDKIHESVVYHAKLMADTAVIMQYWFAIGTIEVERKLKPTDNICKQGCLFVKASVKSRLHDTTLLYIS